MKDIVLALREQFVKQKAGHRDDQLRCEGAVQAMDITMKELEAREELDGQRNSVPEEPKKKPAPKRKTTTKRKSK